MGNVNKVILMGNLTRDPELKHTNGGTALAKFGMAINETYGGRDDGERKQRTTFVDVVAWGRTGEVINEHLKKGDPIYLEGRLDFSSWKDNATGQNRSKIEVVLDKFQFIGGKRDDTAKQAAPRNDNQVPF